MSMKSISWKLGIGNAIVVSILCVNLVAAFMNNAKTRSGCVQVRNESVVYSLKAKELMFNAAQVQQFLQDVSATRGLDGLNDGFDKANSSANTFRELLSEFASFYQGKNERERVKKTETIQVAFEDYYDVGTKMAKLYVERGPEAGNKMMASFDDAANRINKMVDELVSYHSSQLNQSVDSMVENASFNQWFNFACSLLGIGICVIANLIIARAVLLPIRRTTAALREISSGSGDLSSRLPENAGDELGELATYFNRFVEQIDTIVKAIVDQAYKLAASSEVLDQQAHDNMSSTEQLQSKSTTMSNSTKELETSMENSTLNTKRLADNAQDIARSVSELTICIEDISKGASRAANFADETYELASSTNDVISTLDKAAAEIGSVVDVIQDIAGQTNLLALNATIEAARAGQAGKGFEVVASEVKVLARQTAGATDDIRTRVERIQNSSSSVVAAIRKITQSIDRVSEESRTIAGAVEEQSITAKQLAGTVKQSSVVSSDVFQNLKQSSDVAKAMIEEFVEVESGIRRIRDSSNTALVRVQDLVGITEQLESLVARYK